MSPALDGILETSLYVSDLDRSVRFYQDLFEFSVVSEFGERGCAMQAGPRQVLLLFKKGASRNISSPHDGDGELHIAFAIPESALAGWESRLAEKTLSLKKKHPGSAEARASISAIRTATCSSSPLRASGPCTESWISPGATTRRPSEMRNSV